MSFRLKTIIGTALIEAVLLLILVSMTLNYLRTTNYDALKTRASTTASLFATTTKDAVLSYDLASLDAFVQAVLENQDLVYARVVGQGDKVFAQGGSSEFLQKKFVADSNVENAADGVFDTFADIAEGGEVYGRVEIGLDISSIQATISEAKRLSTGVAILEMGLVAFFSFLLGTYLTSQLRVLSSAAQSISDGKLDVQLHVKGKDDIAYVAKAFNSMANHLREASERRDQFELELKELNRFLENRVEQRTLQIENKNRQLEHANQELKATQAKLLHSEKMASIGVLSAGVAHEINNPLAFIMSNLHSLDVYGRNYRHMLDEYKVLSQLTEPEDILKQQQKIAYLHEEYDVNFMNEDLEPLLQDTIEGTERVRDIVKGLKEFSHVDTSANYTLCDLNECIKSTLKMASNELKYHCDIKLELGDLPLTYCCAGQINQVLLNLLLNAGHAIEDQGTITICSKQNGDRLELSVTDTGKGITEEDKGKLFDPFFTTKAVGEGAGLGLAIAYGIAQEHQGDIYVESKVGEGSRFTLSVPLLSKKQEINNTVLTL